MKKIAVVLFIFVSCLIYAKNEEVTQFTYHSKQSERDHRFEYDFEILKLALEKTKEKYGPYKLDYLGYRANYKRVQIIIEDDSYPNLIFKQSVTPDKLEKFAYASFPIDKGVVGYRVALLSKNKANKIKNVKTIEELKKYSIIQGLGWLDTEILKEHGLKVYESGSYEGMFKMVAMERADLFFRGVNEIYNEWQEHKDIDNLSYDKSFLIYYPLPRFFFSNKKNVKAMERVQEGLLIADKDGAIDKLWLEYYGASLEFVNFSDRRVLKLENSLIKGIDKEYEKYNYTFEEIKEMFGN